MGLGVLVGLWYGVGGIAQSGGWGQEAKISLVRVSAGGNNAVLGLGLAAGLSQP